MDKVQPLGCKSSESWCLKLLKRTRFGRRAVTRIAIVTAVSGAVALFGAGIASAASPSDHPVLSISSAVANGDHLTLSYTLSNTGSSDGTTPETYFLQVEGPSGYGTTTPYYPEIQATTVGGTVSGTVDTLDAPPPVGTVVKVQAVVDDTDADRSNGSSDFVTVTVTAPVVPPTCTQVSDAKYTVSIDGAAGTASIAVANGPLCNPGAVAFAAYKSRGANTTPTKDDPQDLVDLAPATISSGHTSLQVYGCYNQLDVILGNDAPPVLTSNQLSAAHILLASANSDSTLCVNKPTTPPSSVPPSSPVTSSTPPVVSTTSVPPAVTSSSAPLPTAAHTDGRVSNSDFRMLAFAGAVCLLLLAGGLGLTLRQNGRRH